MIALKWFYLVLAFIFIVIGFKTENENAFILALMLCAAVLVMSCIY